MADRITIKGRRLTPWSASRLTAEDLRAMSPQDLKRLRGWAATVADYAATSLSRMNGHAILERIEALSRLAPAEPGDVRYEVKDLPEGEGVIVLTVDDRGEVVGRDVFGFESFPNPRSAAFDMIAAEREHQALLREADRTGQHPFELAMEREYERELEERGRYR